MPIHLIRCVGASAVLVGLLNAQRTYYVDDSNPNCPGAGTRANPFCVIQAGIQAATNGDTVLVMPGTYTETLDFLGKAITVRGDSGPIDTVIDAGQKGSGVVFATSEGPSSVLTGFTIRNGTGTLVQLGSNTYPFGGGILCNGASPTIEDVVLEANTARFGAGISGLYGASPVLDAVVMQANTAQVNGGGACFMFDCKPLLVGCIFRLNRCSHTGGGLNFRQSFPTLVNCIFDGNVATDMGGGIRVGAVSGCMIVHCSFTRNSSAYGGGVAVGSDTSGVPQTTVIRSCIFWGNQATNGQELSLNGLYGAIMDIDASDVRGGLTGVYVQNSLFTLTWGKSMIDKDPLWMDPAQGDLHLQARSPCVDAGSNFAVTMGDFEGDPRFFGTTTDMGADELHRHLYHTGNALRGGTIVLQVIGQPNDFAVLLVSPAVLSQPVPVPGIPGLLHLDPRGLVALPLASFPANGCVTLQYKIPTSFPVIDIPSQALCGLSLTNLHVIQVR